MRHKCIYFILSIIKYFLNYGVNFKDSFKKDLSIYKKILANNVNIGYNWVNFGSNSLPTNKPIYTLFLSLLVETEIFSFFVFFSFLLNFLFPNVG